MTKRGDGPYRWHYCQDCPWRGRRLAHANRLPCPRCRGAVFLTSQTRSGPPNSDKVRVRVHLPRPWVERLQPDLPRKLRRLVAEYLGEPPEPRDREVEL